MKRQREEASEEQLVSAALQLLPPFRHVELAHAGRKAAQQQAVAVVRAVDPLLPQLLDVRIVTTRRTSATEPACTNHVSLRVSPQFSTMLHHERALNDELMFCFMASEQLEPLVIVVAVHARLGKLETLTMQQLQALEAAIQQFKCRFRLDGESYAYTCLKERLGASCHSRHFHLKLRIPTEMYLRIFPAMQVLGGNLACKRSALNPFKERWEPLAYKFSAQSMFPWDLTRLLVLSDIK